jgi:hypothetical protein
MMPGDGGAAGGVAGAAGFFGKALDDHDYRTWPADRLVS